MLFRKVTGQRLILSVRRRCICYAVFCCLGGSGCIWVQSCDPFVPLLDLPSYAFSVILLESLISYWLITFDSLILAGKRFTTCFKVLENVEFCT
jgi:hypothetical protein